MWRSVESIALAIRLSNPFLSDATASGHAEVIRRECGRHDCDPITIVAIVTGESNWRPGLVGGSKQNPMVGLGQIRALNYAACRAGLATDGCALQIERLKEPTYNLGETVRAFVGARPFCRRWKRSQHAYLPEVLTQYQGFGRPGAWCLWRRTADGRLVRIAPARFTRQVMAYRRCLLSALERREPPNRRRAFRCWAALGRH